MMIERSGNHKMVRLCFVRTATIVERYIFDLVETHFRIIDIEVVRINREMILLEHHDVYGQLILLLIFRISVIISCCYNMFFPKVTFPIQPKCNDT